MSNTYPRLLVATEFPPNASGGGPAVVRQMLKHWPTEKLFWWSCLRERDMPFNQQVESLDVAAIPSRLYPQRRARAAKSFLLQNVWSRWAADDLQRTINQVRPDVAWLIPHAWSIPPLGRIFANVSFRVHVSMHDYADSCGYVRRFGKGRAEAMAAIADRLYELATTRDAISEPMLIDLRSRTGRDGTILHAGVDEIEFANLGARDGRSAAEIRIAYAGTIIVEETFQMIIEALRTIRSQISQPITLELFSNESYAERPWFDSSWIREHGMLDHDQLIGALSQCTWGFAPMSLFDDDPRYNRFSLPTKFVSYLAAGLPIIVVGHASSSLVQVGTRYHLGACIMSIDRDVIGSTLTSILSIKNPRTEFRGEIERCARSEFDATQMRERLHRQLCGL
jgi:hypothetical protein